MKKIALCRICFNADFDVQQGIQHMVKNTDLEIVYEKLTAMPFQTDDMRPVSMCYMCCAQLRNANKFRLKCMRAENLLTKVLNQILNNEDEIDHKTTLIQRLGLSSALSVSPTVTVSTTDDDNVESEVEDVDIKQEIADEQDVNAEAMCAPESPDVTVAHDTVKLEDILDEREHSPSVSCESDESRDTRAPAASAGDEEYEHVEYLDDHLYECGDVTVAHNTVKSEDILVEREHSLAGSCESDESRDTRAPAASAGDEEYEHVEYLDDHGHEAPVANQPDLQLQNRTGEVLSRIKDTKYLTIGSDIATLEATASKLRNETNITAKINMISNPDNADNSNKKYNSIVSNSDLETVAVFQKNVTKKSVVKIAGRVRNKHLTNINSVTSDFRIHTGDKPFTCDICDKSFTSKCYLGKHTRSHNRVKRFTCDICNKSFISNGNLRRHFQIHTGNKPFTCNVCNKGFYCKSNLERHIRSHTGEKPFTCDVCNKRVTSKGGLIIHMQTHVNDDTDSRIHSGNKPFTCNVCNKSFTCKSALKRHIRCHTGDKYNCNVCNKGFASKSRLEVHMWVHTGDSPFICNVCNKSFTTKDNLVKHIRIHTGVKPFICDVCNKGFTTKFILEGHILIHTGEKPFPCNVCSKRFNSKSILNKHIRIHTYDKIFTCNVCYEGFTRNSHLTFHMWTHTGQKPLICSICGKLFTNKGNLTKHVKNHTGD